MKIPLNRISWAVHSHLLFQRRPSAHSSSCLASAAVPGVEICGVPHKSFLNVSAGARNGCLRSKPFLRLGAF